MSVFLTLHGQLPSLPFFISHFFACLRHLKQDMMIYLGKTANCFKRGYRGFMSKVRMHIIHGDIEIAGPASRRVTWNILACHQEVCRPWPMYVMWNILVLHPVLRLSQLAPNIPGKAVTFSHMSCSVLNYVWMNIFLNEIINPRLTYL